MPNGHGGVVRFLSPIILTLVLGWGISLYLKTGQSWIRVPIYVLAAAIAERFSWHLLMWNAVEYGGAYISKDAAARARKRYAIAAFALVLAALLLVTWLL